MSYEEKGTWVYVLVSAGVYAGYVAVVLGRAQDPITATAYQVPLLASIGIAMLAAVVVRVLVEIIRPSDTHRPDTRDRDIERFALLRSWWLLIAGALTALAMALAQWPHFWIANVIYLGFVMQAVVSSVVKIIAYRRGF